MLLKRKALIITISGLTYDVIEKRRRIGMNVSREQIKILQDTLTEKVPDEVLVKVFEMFPDTMAFTMAQEIVFIALKGVSRDLPQEIMVERIKAKIKENSVEKKEGPWSAKKITRDYYDSLLLEMRLMEAELPSTEFNLFGESFSSPIMTAALSHLGTFNPDLKGPMVAYAEGARLSNMVHWLGMGSIEEMEQVMATGARTIKIIKPYEDEEEIYKRIRRAEELGALAVGIDIDHTFTKDGEIDVVFGEKMAPKSLSQMKAYVESTKLPFIIKGVLSVHDAIKSMEIGAKGIVISHHGGRLNYAVPPLMVLPEIVKAVGEQVKIFVDCGISSGMDAYKALALGASAVSVGGHLIPLIRKGGAFAVSERLAAMNDELRGVMAYTGVKDVYHFDPTVIRKRNF